MVYLHVRTLKLRTTCHGSLAKPARVIPRTAVQAETITVRLAPKALTITTAAGAKKCGDNDDNGLNTIICVTMKKKHMLLSLLS